MDRNTRRTTQMPIRFIHLSLLVLLAWITPLTVLHQKLIPGEPSFDSNHSVFQASGDSGQSKELPRLVEEEEENEAERHLQAPPMGAATILSSSCSAPPKAFLLPGERCLVSSALPRGPPACWL